MTSPLVSSAWSAIELVGNHVWQSTLFAAVAGLLTLMFRKNHAQVRYGLWLAASVKFLIPFAALVAIGSQVGWHSPSAVPQPQLTFVMEAISQPFSRPELSVPAQALPAAASSRVATVAPFLLLGTWLCGCAAMLVIWALGWRRVAAAVRTASRVEAGRELGLLRRLEKDRGIKRPIDVVSSHTSLEPGVFGIFKPVLLWPRTIGGRLTDAEVEAILAHELSHVRRYDNLSAALHTVVQAVFWFHPLVWWLGTRLIDERERACDEDVIRLGSEPQAYAESLLKTCEFCVESPLTCVAGVSGSDLKQRIEAIMRGQTKETLNVWRRVLLATVGLAVIAGPMVVGLLSAPRLYGQTQAVNASGPTFDVASVKKNKSGAVGRQFGMPADRFEATSVPLRVLIQLAYGELGPPPEMLPEYQISGGPNWIDSDRFDIVAKAGSNLPPYPEGAQQKILMLRALLAERFKLVVHHETREGPIYALVLARSDGTLGPKIRRSDVDCVALTATRRGNTGPPPPLPAGQRQPCLIQTGPPGNMIVSGQTLSAVAHFFSELLNRVVLDQTGLAGAFDLDLQFNPEGIGPLVPPPGIDRPVSDNNPSIFTAVQEQLGLKLESTRGPVDVLVIDHVEQPTDNQTDPAVPSTRSSTQAQLPTAPAKDHPAFAAASVKPNKSGSPVLGITPQPGGRFMATNMSVGQLLRSAYGIPMFRLVGGPDWVESERFDVVATAGYNATFSEMRLMMQTLLAERFKMKIHAETQEQPAFELVTARRDGRLGANLRRSDVDCTGKDWPNALLGSAPPQCGFIGPDPEIPISSGRSRFAVRGTSMEALSQFLQGAGGRYVFNRTGLSGYFDGEFDFTAEMGPPAPPDRPDLNRANLPSIFTVVQEQLGLKLDATRGPVEVLVIDSVDRPTPD